MNYDDAAPGKRLASKLRGFLSQSLRRERTTGSQGVLDIEHDPIYNERWNPSSGPAAFIEFLCAAIPDGDVYLFGGALRDFALFGREGFSSDLDVVVTCSSSTLSAALPSDVAKKNKFGGFRLKLRRQEIDVWAAPDTWAFSEGYFTYRGISSLLDTTVINWDSILLNLRTFDVICKPGYFQDISSRHLDVQFTINPNPHGALIKILRYITLKSVNTVSRRLFCFVKKELLEADGHQIVIDERRKFGDAYINEEVLNFFSASRPRKVTDGSERIQVWKALFDPQLL